jgi:DNA-binding transcriptional ArsR family regulator
MTNAELSVLSLIAEAPRHGYEIEQVIEARGMRDWTEIGFSSIYYLLKKLEKDGMIESELRQQEGKGPARKVYSITRQGRQAQIKGTIAALSTPLSKSVPFLLGLSNFPIVPREQVLGALNSYAVQMEARLKQMLHRAADQQPLPAYVAAMFDYSQDLAEAELNWIRNFIQEVEQGNA